MVAQWPSLPLVDTHILCRRASNSEIDRLEQDGLDFGPRGVAIPKGRSRPLWRATPGYGRRRPDAGICVASSPRSGAPSAMLPERCGRPSRRYQSRSGPIPTAGGEGRRGIARVGQEGAMSRIGRPMRPGRAMGRAVRLELLQTLGLLNLGRGPDRDGADVRDRGLGVGHGRLLVPRTAGVSGIGADHPKEPPIPRGGKRSTKT